jgi:hypothetical protein
MSGKYAARPDRDANGHIGPETPLCQREMKAVLNRGEESKKRNRADDNASHDLFLGGPMTENSTITDMGPPSFVRQLREVDDMENLVACFDLWAPTVTGYAPLDHDLGRQHCRAALAYSHSIGTANFLLYVVMAFSGRPLGNLEHGFIAELVESAKIGRLPPLVSDSLMAEVARLGANIEAMREQEQFMLRALSVSCGHPELFYNYVVELISSGESIGAAVYLLAGAAFSGVLH